MYNVVCWCNMEFIFCFLHSVYHLLKRPLYERVATPLLDQNVDDHNRFFVPKPSDPHQYFIDILLFQRALLLFWIKTPSWSQPVDRQELLEHSLSKNF